MLKLFGSKEKQKKSEDVGIMQNRSSSSSLLKSQPVAAGKTKIAGLKAPSALPMVAPSTSKLPAPGGIEKVRQ